MFLVPVLLKENKSKVIFIFLPLSYKPKGQG